MCGDFFACREVCVSHVCNAPSGQKRALDPPGLELQTVWDSAPTSESPTCAGKLTWVFWKSSKYTNHWTTHLCSPTTFSLNSYL